MCVSAQVIRRDDPVLALLLCCRVFNTGVKVRRRALPPALVPDEPCVIVRRTGGVFAFEPHDPIEQHDLVDEVLAIAE